MYPSIDAMIPIGMLIKKMYSQPTKVVITQPRTMPSIAPLFHPSEIYPKALPRTFGGNVSATIAPQLACMKAPPSAWIIREAISNLIFGDKPQNNEQA